MSVLRPALATLLVLGCAACGGPAVTIPDGDVSYAANVEEVIVFRCEGCHTAEEAKARLVLERGRGYRQLVERSSIQVGRPLVVPGDPEASYLWRKLTNTAEEGKGMPSNTFGYRRLPETELELIRVWIEDGARP